MGHSLVRRIEGNLDDSSLNAVVQVWGSAGTAIHVHVVATQATGAMAVGSRAVILEDDKDHEVALTPKPGQAFVPEDDIKAIALAIETWSVTLKQDPGSGTPPAWEIDEGTGGSRGG